jgi:hypothetical protein
MLICYLLYKDIKYYTKKSIANVCVYIMSAYICIYNDLMYFYDIKFSNISYESIKLSNWVCSKKENNVNVKVL